MESAALCIEDLANNVVGRFPLLDVHWPGSQSLYQPVMFSWFESAVRFYPSGGPAVGPAVHPGPRPVGQNLEAVACSKRFSFDKLFFRSDIFWLRWSSFNSQSSEAPNPLRLVVDRPPRAEIVRYRSARQKEALYKAAARLWAKGIEIGKAIEIVETAMKEAGELWKSTMFLKLWVTLIDWQRLSHLFPYSVLLPGVM